MPFYDFNNVIIDDIKKEIFNFAIKDDPKTFATLMQVCRKWKEIVDLPQLRQYFHLMIKLQKNQQSIQKLIDKLKDQGDLDVESVDSELNAVFQLIAEAPLRQQEIFLEKAYDKKFVHVQYEEGSNFYLAADKLQKLYTKSIQNNITFEDYFRNRLLANIIKCQTKELSGLNVDINRLLPIEKFKLHAIAPDFFKKNEEIVLNGQEIQHKGVGCKKATRGGIKAYTGGIAFMVLGFICMNAYKLLSKTYLGAFGITLLGIGLAFVFYGAYQHYQTKMLLGQRNRLIYDRSREVDQPLHKVDIELGLNNYGAIEETQVNLHIDNDFRRRIGRIEL